MITNAAIKNHVDYVFLNATLKEKLIWLISFSPIWVSTNYKELLEVSYRKYGIQSRERKKK